MLHVEAESGTAPDDDPVERRIAGIASRQHGVVTRAEACDAGVSRNELTRLVRNGALIRIHTGVYRAGHQSPSMLAIYMAATKACGDGSGVSWFAGAHLLGLVRDRPARIDVTSPGHRRPPGIVVHRARRTRLALTRVRGIPVTTPAWTLLDVAPLLDDAALGRACHQAQVRYRLQPDQVSQVLTTRGPVKGSRRLIRILASDDPLLLSRLEAAYLRILRNGREELPATNRRLTEGYVDCRWSHLGLIVELDSYRFHGSRHAWERDRDRDRAARRRCEEMIRFTADDVFGHPDEVLAHTRERLAYRRSQAVPAFASSRSKIVDSSRSD